MNKIGPVIIVEDDEDDQDILKQIFKKLNYPNKIIFFENGQQAFDFLKQTRETPFIIVSDIMMPSLGGFELKNKIRVDCESGIRCIPYIFFSTTSTKKILTDAFNMSAQGYFIKDNSMAELEKTIKLIMDYWGRNALPV